MTNHTDADFVMPDGVIYLDGASPLAADGCPCWDLTDDLSLDYLRKVGYLDCALCGAAWRWRSL